MPKTLPSNKKVKDIVDFSALQIKIAAPEEISSWSYGEVKKQKKMVCLMRKFSDQLKTTSVTVANINGFVTKGLFVINVA